MAAIILAGGYSSRMGTFKPLLKIGDLPAVDVLVSSFVSAGIGRIVIVTGHQHERLTAHIDQNAETQVEIKTVFNENYSKGMFTSVQKGISFLRSASDPAGGEIAGTFVIPVDCPAVSAGTIKMMMDEIRADDDTEMFFAPVYMGKKGHPLYIPQRYWREIIEHDGRNGLKGITDNYPNRMKRIPVDDEGILLDMDDPAGYERVKEFCENGSGPDLISMAKGRRFILIRHGQIRQHKEKIFLGQTDVPLSKNGVAEAKAAGEKLTQITPDTDRIYTSPLIRAKDTAGIIAGEAAGSYAIVPKDGFSEIALGEWDGKFISEIKEKYPEQFRARGENKFQFKTGNGSENFYDLQYRVLTTLKEILKNDHSRDIVIVSHRGVIRTIENNLAGKSIDEPWEEMDTGGIRVLTIFTI